VDLRSFKLHLVDRHVRAVFAGVRDDRPADLEGEAFARVLAVAQPLVDAVAARAGARLRALSVDAVAHVIRASTEGEAAARVEGGDYDAVASLIMRTARAIAEEARPRRPLPADASLTDPKFWETLYREQRDHWELGRAAPPLARWFAAHSPAGRRALVLGCGRGHEARLLARAGAQVVGLYLAEDAVAAARALAAAEGVAVEFRRGDLFALPASGERWDLAVEHTCLCAIDPARRAEYVAVVAGALAPGGEWIGLFWSHGRAGGPPFSVSDEELRALLAPHFEIVHTEIPRDSVALRAGEERLVQARRR
jgi:SAM-dependent methyltransferase